VTAASTRRRRKPPDTGAEAPRWWCDAVLYENHLPSFRDGNGDGIGDLEGLIASLDYLSETLGVGAIWTGPFYRSPLLDTGYDITDHTDVDPVFGDLATVDRLLAEAHARGLRIIVDYVPNHTSDRHPWFRESRSSQTSPKRDWYTWADAAPGKAYPNNWTSEIGGSVWTWDQRTEQFYLHSHLPEQPDLNWRSPAVRAAMLDVLRFWLDRGVDGFRIDVAHMLMKDPELRDNPEDPEGEANPFELQAEAFFKQRHVHDRLHPDVHDVLREMRAVVEEYGGDRVLIGEVATPDWESWRDFYGAALDGIHLPFAFKLIETPWTAPALRESIAALADATPQGAWPILALGNHDRRRLASRIGPSQVRVAAMLLLTLRGTPTILYGDELGLRDSPVPRERQRDYFGLRGGESHDGTRTPMPWSAGPNGGFSSASDADLWLPPHRDYRSRNVAAQLVDRCSTLNLYRRLLALRRTSEALSRGDYRVEAASNGDCLVYSRSAGSERKLIALNLTDEPREVAVRGGRVLLSTTLRDRPEPVAGTLELGPDEGIVIEVGVE
jgi:alpha-glucosidase